MIKLFLFFIGVSLISASDLDVKLLVPDASDNENEQLTVELIKLDENGIESEIVTNVELRVHLVDGIVHLNGNRLQHSVVNHIHLQLSIVEIENGVRMEKRSVPVRIRVLVLVDPLNKKRIFVEEEFMQVDGYLVKQLLVHRVAWNNHIKEKTIPVPMADSNVHRYPQANDIHSYFNGVHAPHLPEHGLMEEPHVYHASLNWHQCHQMCYHWHHCRNHTHNSTHHHGHHGDKHHKMHHHGEHMLTKLKCWFRCLSLKSKIAMCLLFVFTLVTLALCCSLVRRRRRINRALRVSVPPMDDSVKTTAANEKKDQKLSDDHNDFHFQFEDNDPIVVSDREKLIE